MPALVLLAMADLKPGQSWSAASAPTLGITPIIEKIAVDYRTRYAPNTRETIRDEAVKFFVEGGLLVRNADNPARPTNSMNTVYQIEKQALELIRSYGTKNWESNLRRYLAQQSRIVAKLSRQRQLSRIPVTLSDDAKISLSAGGQNPLIKALVEEFCPRFTPGAAVLYVGDSETKSLHWKKEALSQLGIELDPSAKMPDVIAFDAKRNWLVLIEAVSSGGLIDGKRRGELKALFKESTAGLVFVTAFANRKMMQRNIGQISWETEVWIAEEPDHLIHLNGERFLGPYPDVLPSKRT